LTGGSGIILQATVITLRHHRQIIQQGTTEQQSNRLNGIFYNVSKKHGAYTEHQTTKIAQRGFEMKGSHPSDQSF
jgi:hypothetical protein